MHINITHALAIFIQQWWYHYHQQQHHCDTSMQRTATDHDKKFKVNKFYTYFSYTCTITSLKIWPFFYHNGHTITINSNVIMNGSPMLRRITMVSMPHLITMMVPTLAWAMFLKTLCFNTTHNKHKAKIMSSYCSTARVMGIHLLL